MRIARWGNSLAVRIPASLAEALDLKEGDEVILEPAEPGHLTVARDPKREEALARIRAMRWPLPEGYKFDRDEANSR